VSARAGGAPYGRADHLAGSPDGAASGRVAYFDCVGGAAGDMLLAALLDAGADADVVRAGFAGLGIAGIDLRVGRARRGALDCARVEVVAPAEQPRRGPRAVRELVEAAELPEGARRLALAAFARLAWAEASVHGVPVEEVHFHEVGAVDAIADVCGVALAIESLGVERVVCSPLPVARGLVATEHGTLPLPAPATLALLEGAPLYGVEGNDELVTPTGAALLAVLAEGFGPPPRLRLDATGYGAGARDTPSVPNVVRVLVGAGAEPEASSRSSIAGTPVSLIEANLDDMPAELVPDAARDATTAGALDVWTAPAGMKKGRPGVIVSALARPTRERAVAEALLRSTSSLGVRVSRLERIELEREWRSVEVGGEPVRVKLARLGGRIVNVAPEHDDCARVAERVGRPVAAVWAGALAAGAAWLDDGEGDG
jgi:uncharacterized protein (TIGR00299 family) protein